MKKYLVYISVLVFMVYYSAAGHAQLRTPSPNAPYCQILEFKSGIPPVVENGNAITFYYLKKSPDKPYPENQEWTKMIWVQPGGEVTVHKYDSLEEFLYVFEGTGVMTLNGKRQEIHPGMGIYVPPGVERGYANPAQDNGGFDNWLKIVSASAACEPAIGGEMAIVKAAEDTIPVIAYFTGLDWRVHFKDNENARYPQDLFFASRALLTPGLAYNTHVHRDHEETYFILRGHGHMELDNVRYEISPMTNVFFPPGVDHEVINDGDEVMDIIAWGCHTKDVGIFGTRTVEQPRGSFPGRRNRR